MTFVRGSRTRPARRSPDSKVVTLARLARAVGRARRSGRKVVFTNGVFDLLHPGHVMLLCRARRMGDVLVVAVNSDASVRRLKGPGRPFLKQSDRAFMLAALEAVDFVVTFGEDTPLRIIRRVRPDVLVKGGDWSAGAIVGREIVERAGGRVMRVPVRKGLSTTSIAGRVASRRRR